MTEMTSSNGILFFQKYIQIQILKIKINVFSNTCITKEKTRTICDKYSCIM